MNLNERVRSTFGVGRMVRLVRPYTLVDPDRIKNLYTLAHRVEAERIPGDVIECGVYNGGTAAVLARSATRSRIKRTLWLFDSFQGMPATTEVDGLEAKEYVGQVLGSTKKVREVLRKAGADLDRVKIVEGWFQDTFPTAPIYQIALLNIDADWYESVKLCLETFYDRIVPGGFVSIDDYGHWPGCRRAVDDFFAARQLRYALQEVDYTARWFQKL
jgi:O-methyltransferase